jgi:hypothetical protein
MTSNRPQRFNHVPFEDDLVDDLKMPHRTRPLPSSSPQRPLEARTASPVPTTPARSNHRGSASSSSSSEDLTTYHRDHDDADLFQYTPRHVRRRKARQAATQGMLQTLDQHLEWCQNLPLSTVVGVAMMLGALSVLLLSSVIFRTFPHSESPQLRPRDALAPNFDTIGAPEFPEAPRSVVRERLATSGAIVEIAEVAPTPVEAPAEDAAKSSQPPQFRQVGRESENRESESQERTAQPRLRRVALSNGRREEVHENRSGQFQDSRVYRTARTRAAAFEMAARKETTRPARREVERSAARRDVISGGAVTRPQSGTYFRTYAASYRVARGQEFNRHAKPSQYSRSSRYTTRGHQHTQVAATQKRYAQTPQQRRFTPVAAVTIPQRSTRRATQSAYARTVTRGSRGAVASRPQRASGGGAGPRRHRETSGSGASSIGY